MTAQTGGALALLPSQALATGTYRVVADRSTGALSLKTGAAYLAGEDIPSLGKFLALSVNLTAVGGAGTLTATIVGIDGTALTQYTILASAALAAIANTILRVGPGLTAAANLVANDVIPPSFGLTIVVAGNAVTGSINGMFQP